MKISFSHFYLKLVFCSAVALMLPLTSCEEQKAKVKKGSDEPLVTKETDRLSRATSPFLRRHGVDAVDWFPWGEEAFEKAKKENKPVMLVVGYSSCPWTLKMQTETYRDPKMGSYLNKNFICILVDREERPDINNTFQRFTFISSQKSGWPLHVWMTPEALPIRTAIFLSAQRADSASSFGQTVQLVQNEWRGDSEHVARQARARFEDYGRRLRQISIGDGRSKLDRPILDLAYDKLNTIFDTINGGFTDSPKFHQAPSIEFLMEYASQKKSETFGRSQRAMFISTKSLDAIATGALHDHIGGGFHRYCVDVGWTVPQFEKMLFDQGTLASTLLKAHQTTGRAAYAELARGALAYTQAELSHPAGGFYCAENSFNFEEADDPNFVEGAYYLWTKQEADAVAGPECAPVLDQIFGLRDGGNLPVELQDVQITRFHSRNILRQVESPEDAARSLNLPLEKATALYRQGCQKLLEARRLRSRPMRDEKVLPGWNATMISALVLASCTLEDSSSAWLQRAEKSAQFTLDRFLAIDYNRPRFAEDYTMLIQALLDLYETTGAARWLESAISLQTRLDAELWDEKDGGYWDGPEDPHIKIRMKICDEAAELSSNATGSMNLTRLARLTGKQEYLDRNLSLFRMFAGETAANPQGATTPSGPATHTRLLQAYDHFSRPGWQFIVTGNANDPARQELKKTLLKHYRPNSHILYMDGAESEALLTKANEELKALISPGSRVKAEILAVRNFRLEEKLATPAELKAFLDKEF